MRPTRRWRSRAIATLAIVILGANCSSSDDSDRPAPLTPDAEDRSIRLGLPSALVLDPAAASLAEPSELMTVDLLYDGLARLDADGAALPALAESWSTDATQKVWTFRLDTTRTFSDGAPITAPAVIRSLEHLLRGGDASLPALRLEGAIGFRDFVEGRTPNVAGFRSVDDHTVELAFTGPMGTLPVLLAGASYGVVDPDAVPRADAPVVPLRLTGDWLVDRAEDGAVSLAPRLGADVELDVIELVPHPDPAAAYAAFDEGVVDWAEVPDDQVGDAVAAYGDAAFSPFHAELLLGFNLGNVTLAQNPALRAAIAQAIDREAIVEAVYPDLADPLGQIVPTGVPGRQSLSCEVCDFDPVEARRLLAEAYPGGVPLIHIDFDQSPAQEALARIVADDLRAVGLEVELRARSLEDYKQFVVSGGHELFSFGWIAAYGSPDAYLTPLFQSASDDNLVGFASPDLDEQLGVARSAPAGAPSSTAWADAERTVLEASVVVPIAQFRTQVVVAERVEGLHHAVDGTVDWSDVSVD